MKVGRYRDKNQHLEVGIKGSKLQTMYHSWEKSCSLNTVRSWSGKH